MYAFIVFLSCSLSADSATSEPPVDDDGDGYLSDVDCDETNPLVHPGAADSACDGVDDDCDGHADEDSGENRVWYADVDGDSYGDFGTGRVACLQPEGFVEDFSDCDDQQDQVHPEQIDDQCDGVDTDCDRHFDEDSADAVVFYADADNDGYGNEDQPIYGCVQPIGAATSGGDCDDEDAETSPIGTEICSDARDQDCDGVTDGGCGGPVRVDLREFPLITGGLRDRALLSFNPVIGLTVASGGDADGDGLDDVAVGLPHAWEEAGYYLGKIYFISEVPAADRLFTDRVGSIVGEVEYAKFAKSIAFLGDVDGDGDDELVAGAENQGDSLGAAYLFHGGPHSDRPLSDASATVRGTEVDAGFGLMVASGGNALGLGHAMLVAAPFAGGVGMVYVFDAEIPGDGSTDDARAVLIGESGSQCTGEGLSGDGDLDGDGTNDLIVGAGGGCDYADVAGAAWIVLGPVAGASSLSDADARFSGEVEGGRLGMGVLQPGDIDGDGRGDLVLSAPAIETAAGRNGIVYVLTGGISGESDLRAASIQLTAGPEDWTIQPPLSASGDVDDDGRADFLASTPYGGDRGQGGAYVFTGLAAGSWDANEVGSWLSGATEFSYYGAALAATSDLDGDGVNEIAVGGQESFADETASEDVGAVSIVSTAGWF